MDELIVHTDGGARGNPGPAGIGVVFSDSSGEVIYTFSKYIGEATNNQAEYDAIIAALEILKKSKWFRKNNHPKAKVVCYLDSKLVVEQVRGNYKVKNGEIKKKVDKIHKLLSGMKLHITFTHIPREKNKHADKLVNKALDNEKKNDKSKSANRSK